VRCHQRDKGTSHIAPSDTNCINEFVHTNIQIHVYFEVELVELVGLDIFCPPTEAVGVGVRYWSQDEFFCFRYPIQKFGLYEFIS
jgi:hypothetical protein